MRCSSWMSVPLLLLSACALTETTPPTPQAEAAQTLIVEPSTLQLVVGTSVQLDIRVLPAQAADQTVQFSSEPAGVVAVSEAGSVTALATGAATLHVSLPRDGLAASVQIVVWPAAHVSDGCEPADPRDLSRFPACPTGGGIYGRWIADAHGLPAYDFTLDQRSDPRAVWPHSEAGPPISRERRDHFIVLGNRRINFLAVDDGYVSLYSQERAPLFLNRFAEDQRNLGGGFSYIQHRGRTHATAHRYASDRTSSRRIFGAGYFQTDSKQDGLRVQHTIFAPAGDDPILIDEVEIENLSDEEITPHHVEYWDVNRHQLLINWVRTGLGAAPSDRSRDQLNDRFVQRSEYDAANRVLWISTRLKPGVPLPDASTASREDLYPPTVFLAALDAPVDASYGDQDVFFGSGTPAQPEAVQRLLPSCELAPRSALGQPGMLALRSDLRLSARAKRTLRFAYGYVPSTPGSPSPQRPEKLVSMLDAYRGGNGLAESLTRLRPQLVYAYAPTLPLLHRETAWRSQLLLGHTVYNTYYQEHYTPQGSAYLYLHGADGVPRDQALFALSLAYVDPALAKGNLRLMLSLQDGKTGKLPYSMTNFGQIDGALIHNNPSDLDLFLFLAVGEYIAATADLAFLRESVPYYPRGSAPPAGIASDSVLDHLRVAFRHLKNDVGLGPNGLIRIQDGDWSDGIVYEDLSPTAIAFTQAKGESVPNSQMALYALPIMAAQIEAHDAALAAELRAFSAALVAPVRKTFGGRWFGRAWLRNSLDQPYLKGNDQRSDPFRANFIDLEAQPWGILSGLLSSAERDTLIDNVWTRLDAPSSIGPSLREGGMVWPAISQLMTWAYARSRPQLAWRSLKAHLYATHAMRFPEVWPGIWSAPDGLNSTDGQSWVSPVTPMTDFPVANINADAMWILGLLRTVGVQPSSDGKGLDISPAWGIGYDDFVVETALLRVESQAHRLAGEYRAHNAGRLSLRLTLPLGARATLRIDDRDVAVDSGQQTLVLPLVFTRGQRIRFEARF